MSQYSSRIHVKVSSPKVWSKFRDEDDASFDLAELAETEKTSFIIDGEWSSFEDELTGIVKALAETLGKDGIIIADTTNINVDPYDYCIYYLGSSVHTREFSIYRGRNKCEMFFETNIEDIPGWLNYGGFSASEAEKKVLFRCGLLAVGKHYEQFSTDLSIPDPVYLRETSFKNRSETIERTIIGEEVYFLHSKDSYDPLRLEVMSELGSLGYLPSNISDKLTPVLANNLLKYTATTVEVIPVSLRNKHAKSSEVAIRIKAEMSDIETPAKKSVPKSIDRDKRVAQERSRFIEQRKAKSEEARKAEEERRRKEEEARKAEEERRRKEEEARKAEEERRRKEEEARKAEEERRRKEEEARKAEEERRRKEEEARKAEEERKRKEEEARKAEEERRRKEEEARKAEEERRRKEEEARKAEEERRRKEEEARKAEEERRRKEEEARKAEAEAKAKREEELREYNESHKKWDSECADVYSKRSAFVEAKVTEEKAAIVNAATKKRDNSIANANAELKKQADRKALAESTLASLGVFKFGEKKAQKAIVEEAAKLSAEAQASISAAESAYSIEMSEADKKAGSKRVVFQKMAEDEYPLPLEPKKPD